jgi:5'-deoxynucleotidase YfbR-like HD superfamily hydrolase
MAIEREQILRTSRFAGSVKRWHVWPTLQQQTVADHSWHLMRIWFALWGPMPPEISTYFIWHDAGELFVGDFPFPVKQKSPELKRIIDELEEQAVLDMGGVIASLTEEQRQKVKLCDYLEMYEFGLQEMSLGNKYAQPIVDDIYEAIFHNITLGEEDWKRVTSYLAETRKVLTCAL